MDDEKKEKVKEMEIGVVLFIALIIVIALWPAILSYLTSIFSPLAGFFNINGANAGKAAGSVMGIIIGISLPLSLFFLFVIIYCVEQLKHIRKKDAQKFDAKVEPAYGAVPKDEADQALRWENVKKRISSANPSDWREAIMEADIILDRLLSTIGYQGEGVGEKLKRVEKADFETLDDAWEAHKIRNQIAHEGSQFAMSQHEANRVVNLYKKVLEEFYYIQ